MIIQKPTHARTLLGTNVGEYGDAGHSNLSPISYAIIDPTPNHDGMDTASYGRKMKKTSLWYNTNTRRFWICVDPTATSAVWKELTSGIAAPSAVSNVSPTGAATGQDIYVTLQSSPLSPDCLCEFWISESAVVSIGDPGFQQFLSNENTAQFVVKPNNTYYWKCRQISGETFLASSWSEITIFETLNFTPTLVYPFEGATDVPLDCDCEISLPTGILAPIRKVTWYVGPSSNTERTSGVMTKLLSSQRSGFLAAGSTDLTFSVSVYFVGVTDPVQATCLFSTKAVGIDTPVGATTGSVDLAGTLRASSFWGCESASLLVHTSSTWEVSNDGFVTNVWESIQDTKNLISIQLPTSIPTGNYQWRVKYYSNTEESSYSTPLSISIEDLASFRMVVSRTCSVSYAPVLLKDVIQMGVSSVEGRYVTWALPGKYNDTVGFVGVVDANMGALFQNTTGLNRPTEYLTYFKACTGTWGTKALFATGPNSLQCFQPSITTSSVITLYQNILGSSGAIRLFNSFFTAMLEDSVSHNLLLAEHQVEYYHRPTNNFNTSLYLLSNENTLESSAILTSGETLKTECLTQVSSTYFLGGYRQEVPGAQKNSFLLPINSLDLLNTSGTLRTFDFGESTSCLFLKTIGDHVYLCGEALDSSYLLKFNTSTSTLVWSKKLYYPSLKITGMDVGADEGVEKILLSFTIGGSENTIGGLLHFGVDGSLSKGLQIAAPMSTCTGVVVDGDAVVFTGVVLSRTPREYIDLSTSGSYFSGEQTPIGSYTARYTSFPTGANVLPGSGSLVGICPFEVFTTNWLPTVSTATWDSRSPYDVYLQSSSAVLNTEAMYHATYPL